MDIQQDNIEPLKSESEPQNNKYGIEQQPLDQISAISFSAEKDCDQNLMADLKSILDIGHSKSKIEIILTDLKPKLVEQFKSEQNKFSQINLKFQNTLQSNSQLLQEETHQIDPVAEQLIQQRIYQFQEQAENQVTQRMKLILFCWKIIPIYTDDPQNINQNIQINLAQNQFQVHGKDENQATDLFVKMKNDLNITVILLKECQSFEEARSISSILQKDQIYIDLQNNLNSKMVIVDSSTELNLDLFQNDNQLQDQVHELQTGQPTIFAIIKVNIQQYSIQDLQERFIKFIDDSKNIKILEDQQIFELACLPNLIEIQQQIESLNIYGCEIEISEPNMDYQRNKFQIEVTYTLWYPGVMQITSGQSMMNQIKNQIYDIFNPIVSLPLKDKDQIEIWYDYLNREYEINFEEIIIKTVRNTETNEIEIQLSGCIDRCLVMKESIQNELNEIEFKVIVLQYKTNIPVFNRIVQNYSNQFKKQLELIQEQYADLILRIANFNTDSNEIEFKVQYRSNLKYEQIEQLLQNEIMTQIQVYTVIIDFANFLSFLKLDITAFEEGYATIVGQLDDSFTFLSTKQFLEPVKVLIDQFQQAILQKPKTVLFNFDSNLVFKRLQEMIQTEQIKLQDDVKFNFILTSIQLVGPEESVLRSQSMIIDVEQQLKLQLIKRPLDLNSKEVNFIIKNIKLDQYLKQFECEIKVNSDKLSSRNQIASTLSFEGKTLNVVYDDISKFQCQAIVNSLNHIMSFEYVDVLSRVSTKIFDMAGPSYKKFCEKYIQEHKTLECGRAVTYKMPNLNDGVQNYIINVSIPIYQNCEQKNQDYLNIEENIRAIFVEANKLNITSLALSILGGGACGYSFQQIVQNTLLHIINSLYSQQNQTVQIVDVIELEEFKLTQICEVLQQIFQSPELNRQIKYQWQWTEGNIYKNYDDEEINKQIDEEFEQFKNDQQKNKTRELKLIFPFTKQPGTHLVNLKTMQMTDISLGTKIIISLQKDQGKQKFLFGNVQIDDDINEYLLLQKLVNNLEFQIYYKKQKIIFNRNGMIKQFNESTGFSRNVRAIPYLKNQQQKTQNILIGKNIQVVSKPYDKDLNRSQKYEIFVESFDMKVIEDLQNVIKTQIYNNTIIYLISLPLIQVEDFNYLKMFIQRNSIQADENIINGQNVTVRIFQREHQILQSQIEAIQANKKQYPINWNHQNRNLIKVDLPNNSEEYLSIQSEFKKTDNGKISKIYRLQNQRLWKNYTSQLKELQVLSLKRNSPLTQQEQDRYLWYGVKEQHPNAIYKSMKEAFDINQNDKCLWSKAIPFSEQANDVRGDSYKLTENDDPQHVGKLVVLCCKVMTGKMHSSNPDACIRRPPDGYDCVRKLKGGNSIFILYGIGVKRVYPAYEIIYQ